MIEMNILNPWIASEIHPLTHVLLGKPSRGLQYLTKGNYRKYLFSGQPNTEAIYEEHNAFINLLENNGIQSVFVDDLLFETLDNIEARQWIISRLLSEETHDRSKQYIHDTLLNLETSLLTQYLINGVKFSEISPQKLIQSKNFKEFLFFPLPNNYFTRDASVWLHDGVIIGGMKSAIRRREALIMSCIYRYSKKFNYQKRCKIWFDNSQFNSSGVFLEGGDLMLLDKHTLLLGHSQRTNYNAINILTDILFAHTDINKIIVPELPKLSNCIHLDMVLSMLNYNTFNVSKTLIRRIQCVREISKCEHSTKIEVKKSSDLIGMLQKHLNNEINIIALDDTKIELFEQQSCANNLLTLKPGVVVSYEHNHYTNSLLIQAGIQVITIKSSQLQFGNGGAHCMSCPITREDKLTYANDPV